MSRIDPDVDLVDVYEDDGADEYERFHRSPRSARPVLTVVVTVVAVALVALGLFGVWVLRQLDPPGPTGTQIALLRIPKGATVDIIADELEREGVVASASVFSWYAQWRDHAEWKAGDYATFHKNSSMSEAAAVLDAGPVAASDTALLIVPGTRLADAFTAITKAFPNVTAEQLMTTIASGAVKSKYLPADASSWEGFLMPDTYRLAKDADATKILSTLVKAFDKTLDDLGYGQAEALTGHSAYELVVIASLIERERGQPSDEPGKIARVIYNRLDDGTPLGVDAAILYGLGRRGGEITQKDLDTETPYNTRKVKGLPPTPIALPSKAALQGAIHPTDGPWIYYVLVSKDPPSHLFTASAKEFEDAKQRAKDNGVF